MHSGQVIKQWHLNNIGVDGMPSQGTDFESVIQKGLSVARSKTESGF